MVHWKQLESGQISDKLCQGNKENKNIVKK